MLILFNANIYIKKKKIEKMNLLRNTIEWKIFKRKTKTYYFSFNKIKEMRS